MFIIFFISFHRGWTRIFWWTRVSSHYNFLSSFAVRIELWCDRARVVFCLLGLPVNWGGGGGEVTWRVSDWSTSVGCWDCLHVLDPVSCTMGRCVFSLFTVCSTGSICVLDPRRVSTLESRFDLSRRGEGNISAALMTSPSSLTVCHIKYLKLVWPCSHSSGAVWESRWTSWAVRPNEPSGFRGRKELLNRASALVTTYP